MKELNLDKDEVILFEDTVYRGEAESSWDLTLTSKRIVLYREIKKLFKQPEERTETIYLETIKIFNNEVQVNQKGEDVKVQTTSRNYNFSFDGILAARKFTEKIINVLTGTSATERGMNKLNKAINAVDDTLGINMRGTIKGVVENGVVGTLMRGIGTKKRKK